jgi:glycosyltransferase involved in cell wall biosynthesis
MPARLAVVMQTFPSADSGGPGVRNRFLASALAESYEVSAYCASYPEYLEQADPELERRLHRLATAAVSRPVDPVSEPPIPLLNALARRDQGVETLRRAFETDHLAAPFDVVVLETCYASLITGPLSVPTVVDEHNIESVMLETFIAAGGLDDSRRAQVVAQRAFERRVWGRAAAVACVSEGDAEHIRPHASRVHVIPNGCAASVARFQPPSARVGTEVIFVGSMNFAANEAAACFLAEEVMPRLRRTVPDARLVICGQGPSERLLALRGERCEVTGRVASVAPYLGRAAVAAIPLRHGAGTSLKTVEAMAHGLPLVSSTCGVRGLPVVADRHYLPAETADDFCAQIARVLGDRPAFDRMARAAREVADAYDWRRIGRAFADVVDAARQTVAAS